MVNTKTDVSVTVAPVGEIEVTVWNAAQLDINTAVAYVKSGQREIQEYVDNVNKPELNAYTAGCKEEITDYLNNTTKPELDLYVAEDKKSELDSLCVAKQEEINDYVETVSKPVIDNYVSSEVETLVAQAQNSRDEAASFAAAAEEKAQSSASSLSSAQQSEAAAAASEARCEEIFERLGTVIKIKGRVDTPEDLPTEGNLDGDAYLVGVAGLTAYPEYYWFSDHWEFLGTSADKIEWGTLQGILANQTDLQNVLDGKQDVITGAASTIVDNDLTANMVLISDADGKITNSLYINENELRTLNNITGNIQTQLNAKQSTANLSQILDDSTTNYPSNAAVSNAIGNIDMSSKANIELDNLSSAGNTVIDNRVIDILGSEFQVVEALPESPVAGVFYFVKE